MLRKKLSLFLFFLMITIASIAQVENGRNEIGVNVGGLFYQGDLAPGLVGAYKTARPVIGIFYNRILSPYLSARANIVLGALAGDDALNKKPDYMRLRNFNFHTPLAELSGMLVFNPFGTNIETGEVKFSPYVFAGGGVSFLNVHRDWSKIDSSMAHVGSATYNGLLRDSATIPPHAIPILPVGAGVKYAILPRIALIAEANYRFSFTDYIDGFSYAANPQKKDAYYSLTIGAVYNFGGSGSGSFGGWRKPGKSKTGCPTVF